MVIRHPSGKKMPKPKRRVNRMGNTIITIGRQYGSGGREIGRKVAEKLGIKCYDKELLAVAAKESGICEELFENHDEKPTNSFLYSLVMDTYSRRPLYISWTLCGLRAGGLSEYGKRICSCGHSGADPPYCPDL